jgi:hypothetical protein
LPYFLLGVRVKLLTFKKVKSLTLTLLSDIDFFTISIAAKASHKGYPKIGDFDPLVAESLL